MTAALLGGADPDAVRELPEDLSGRIAFNAASTAEAAAAHARLAALYDWLIRELSLSTIKPDVNRIGSCRSVVEPLRDAWRQAAASLAGAPS